MYTWKVLMIMRSDLILMNMPASGDSQLDSHAKLCSQKPMGTMVQYGRLSMVGTSKKQQGPASLPGLAHSAETHLQTAQSCCSLTQICNHRGTEFASAT
jgi:hypothetical protein